MNPTSFVVTDCKPFPPVVVFDHQGFTLLGHWWFPFALLKLLASSVKRRWRWTFYTFFIFTQKFFFVNKRKSTLRMCCWSSVCITWVSIVSVWYCSPTFNIIKVVFSWKISLLTLLKITWPVINSIPLIGWNYSIQTGEPIL